MTEKSRKILSIVILSLGYVLGTTTGQMASADSSIRWNGFFTGAYSQSDNEYSYGRFYQITKEGSYLSDTRLGLQGTAKINEKVTLTTQFVAKNNRDNFAVNANWLFANLTLKPGLDLKLGRMQQPIYLFSSQLEAGYSTPWVRPPLEVYEQQFFNDYTGIELQFKKYLFEHDITLKLIHGVQNNNITSPTLANVFGVLKPIDEELSSDDYVGVVLQFEGDFYRVSVAGVNQTLKVSLDPVALNTLFRQTTTECLTASSECLRLTAVNAVITSRFDGTETAVDGDLWSIGIDMKISGIRLISEYVQRTVSTFTRQATYVSLLYATGATTPYLTLGYHNTKGEDSIDPQTQSSIALGLRYEWMANTAFKIELLNADPKDGNRGLFDVGYTGDVTMESLNSITIALDMIF
ncbi:MAG: hypothetical protein JKY67_22745 [Pseudomonadales bacterium]|nr:hypothetical protein [Pseudomonadales bacterium]